MGYSVPENLINCTRIFLQKNKKIFVPKNGEFFPKKRVFLPKNKDFSRFHFWEFSSLFLQSLYLCGF